MWSEIVVVPRSRIDCDSMSDPTASRDAVATSPPANAAHPRLADVIAWYWRSSSLSKVARLSVRKSVAPSRWPACMAAIPRPQAAFAAPRSSPRSR